MKILFEKRFEFFLCATIFCCTFFCKNVFAQSQNAEIQFVQKLSSILQNGTTEEALNLFDSIPEKLKDDVDMMSLKASLYLSANKILQAQELASSLYAKEPKNLEVLNINVMVAKKKGDNASKAKFIKQILAIEPNNAGANIELADEQALKKNWRNARDYYRKALVSSPEDTDALFGYAKMCYYMEKDKDAKDAFNKLYKIDPENPQVNAYLAKYEAENKQYKKAIEYVKVALKYEPLNIDHWFDFGTYSRMAGRYKDAEDAWKKAILLESDYFLGYAYLAGLYDEQNRRSDALEYYRKTVEKNPQYYYAYESLGMFAWDSGNWEESQKAFEEALKKNPDSISYKLMVAACMYKRSKIQEMRAFTENLMKKSTDKQGMEYKLIRLYHDRGGDADVALNIQKETNRTKKGRYLFYLALYYTLNGNDSLAHKYYNEVTQMQSPMFFEYRLAQWAGGETN
ncbi:tetratricopeptide repeat protein [Treponema pectinovorum]|uniref:tetratricopeptide repeat protein n=1 Tax=Treponema pectinovorum TaxID=164 RepID=UPI00164D2274|nr:tetratricopeptide repeat protein [Treponema pectinovorum]